MRRFAAKNAKVIRGLAREAREMLLRYDYPGNVRELENLIERAVVLTRDDVVDLADLPLSLSEPASAAAEERSLTAAVRGWSGGWSGRP